MSKKKKKIRNLTTWNIFRLGRAVAVHFCETCLEENHWYCLVFQSEHYIIMHRLCFSGTSSTVMSPSFCVKLIYFLHVGLRDRVVTTYSPGWTLSAGWLLCSSPCHPLCCQQAEINVIHCKSIEAWRDLLNVQSFEVSLQKVENAVVRCSPLTFSRMFWGCIFLSCLVTMTLSCVAT